jgi:hypothetical protein
VSGIHRLLAMLITCLPLGGKRLHFILACSFRVRHFQPQRVDFCATIYGTFLDAKHLELVRWPEDNCTSIE